MNDVRDMLSLTLRAASAGAEALHRATDKPRETTSKGFRDYVTNADFASQNAILAVIQAERSTDFILTEESEQARQMEEFRVPAGIWWIIDPLDGTTNFQLGSPTYCVSVAVASGPRLLAGVLIDPERNLTFIAAEGEGARLNGQPIHVSARSDLIEAIAACDWPRSPGARKTAFELAARFGNACRTFRSTGSAALGIASVGVGWADIYVHQQIQPWDCAAAALIVRESGGVVVRHDGSPWQIMDKDLIATTPALVVGAVGLARVK